MSLTIAFYNIGDGPAPNKIRDLDTLAIRHNADFIHLSETGDRIPMLRVWAERQGYRLWIGNVPGSKSVAVLYKRERDVRRFSRLAVPRMYVGAGAGPSWAKPKAIMGLRLRKLVVLSTHFTPSATRDGRQYRFRRLHYAIHMRVLNYMIRRRRAQGLQVVVVGDFNAPANFRLLDPLVDMNMRQLIKQSTHHNRIIDHAWVTPGVNVRHIDVINLSSDHNAILVKVDLP